MAHFFENERSKAKVRPTISDARGKNVFDAAALKTNPTNANDTFNQCDVKRLGTTNEQHEAAYTYLALAFKITEDQSILINSLGRKVTVAEMFHFAGHAFRGIGQLNRAADAYWRAGVIAEISDFSIRSLARAKSCYSDIGEMDRSDEMHRLEWDARRLRSGRVPSALFAVWKITSAYGTSSRRWFFSVAVFLFAFTAVYQVLYDTGKVSGQQPWTPWVTAAYMSIVTTATVGYGDFVPSHWISQLVVVLNIAFGYALLAIGSTILGRKVLAR
jgi:Ion channel